MQRRLLGTVVAIGGGWLASSSALVAGAALYVLVLSTIGTSWTAAVAFFGAILAVILLSLGAGARISMRLAHRNRAYLPVVLMMYILLSSALKMGLGQRPA